MAKALKDLLGEFQFKEAQFNPRQVTPDMLSSKEVGPTTGPVTVLGLNIQGVSLPYDRQYQKLAQNVLNIYGADSARILTRGAVEPLQLAKRGVDRLSRGLLAGTFGNNTKVGGFVRNALNSFTVPQFPSDEVNNLPGFVPSTKNGLYGSLYNGGVSNSKNSIANALTSFLTPAQFTQNIANIQPTGKVQIGGAAIDLAVNAGFNALQAIGGAAGLNAKRGGGNPSVNKINNPLNNPTIGNAAPKFPSQYAIENASVDKIDGILTGQIQLLRSGGDFYKKYEGINAEDELKTLKLTTDGRQNGISFSSYHKIYNTTSDLQKRITSNTESTQFTDYVQYKDNPYEPDATPVYKFPNIAEKKAPKLFSDQIYKNRKVDTAGIQYDLIVDRQEVFDDATKLKGTDAELEDKIEKAAKASLGSKGEDALQEGGLLNDATVTARGKKRVRTHAELSTKALLNTDSDLINIKIGDIFLMSNLTGLTDTPTVTWGEAKPIGSPYKFYFYEAYEREISFKAQLYAKNSLQLQLLWNKIEKIHSFNLPQGGGLGGLKGKIIGLEIGNIIDENYGFLSSFDVSIPDNSPWEIHKSSQAPFMCEINVTYKVIKSKSNSYSGIKSVDISTTSGISFQKPAPDVLIGALSPQILLPNGSLAESPFLSVDTGGDTITLQQQTDGNDVEAYLNPKLGNADIIKKVGTGTITLGPDGTIKNINLFGEGSSGVNLEATGFGEQLPTTDPTKAKSSTTALGGAPQ
jgi:hypothetical protein